MKPRFIGKASAASIIRARCHGPGVQVVAFVPVAGPVPPPAAALEAWRKDISSLGASLFVREQMARTLLKRYDELLTTAR